MQFSIEFIPTDAQWRQVTEGAGVYVLGYPMGLVGDVKNYPVVRHGVVARIQDYLHGHSATFLIDVAAFPGNSGGPVLSQPEALGLAGGPEPIKKHLLLGIVSQYRTYRDVAISQQTKRPRVIFEESAGLADVVPIDAVLECCGAAWSDIHPSS